MAFRIWPPGIQFFTNDGRVLADGSLSFYDSGTTDPATTWSDPELSTPNSNPVELDGAGRPNTDIWGDGSYRVVLKDAGGVTLVALDNVSGPQGIPDPSLQSGKFLTNDGTDLAWAGISQVPSAEDQPNGAVLTTDGAGNIDWEPLPTPRAVPDPEGSPDGHVLTVDEASPAGYKWAALPADGDNRAWTDQTANRSKGVTYTNSTDRTIEVVISIWLRHQGNSITVTVGGVQIVYVVNGSSAWNNFPVTFSVPAGNTYILSGTFDSAITAWAELRPPA